MATLKLPFYARLALVLIIFIAGGYILILGRELIVPLLFSLLYAILLLPVCNFFENKFGLSRTIASIISVVLLLVIVSFVIYILGAQLGELTTEWPSLKMQLTKLLNTVQQWMAATFHVNILKQAAYIKNITSDLASSSGTIVEKTVLSVSSMLLFIVFMIIYTLLILFYRRLLMRFLVVLVSEKYMSVVYDILENVKRIIRKYITGLFFEMVIVSIIAGLVFWLLGVQYIFLLALLVGILNVIPYVGIFTALVLSLAITFATYDGQHALYAGIAVVCIHLVDSNFLMPKIVGSQVKINPLLVILGVITGEMIWGIAGMFLSIPYMAIAKVIFDRVDSLRPWGILLGEEEEMPKKTKKLIRDVKANT